MSCKPPPPAAPAPAPVPGAPADLFKEPAPPAPSTPVTPTVTPPAPPVPPPVAADAEPDWKALYASRSADLQKGFTPPEPGAKVSVKMSTGSVLEGIVKAIDDTSVTLQRDKVEMKLVATSMAGESRAQLFTADHGKWKAYNQLMGEYKAWHAARARKEMAQEKPIPAKMAGKARFPVPPVNEPSGAVPAVTAYLRENLRNPESLRILAWGAVAKDAKEGWRVTCKYETLAGDFGKVTEQKHFFINDTGEVFQTAAAKDMPAATPASPRR